ncbi:MAG: hypothetical protein H5T64_11905 [Chloroflexi bacterium]|nr:hypothetical protein [Chloroflexota bacterium]
MIHWAAVCANAFWVLGLAVVLSTLSLAHWLARERKVPFRNVLGTPSCQMGCDLGLMLVGVGFFFSARSIWERICWALLAIAYAALGVQRGLVYTGKGRLEGGG